MLCLEVKGMADRYLVTGGAGFIGSHIVRRLVRNGSFTRVIDNLSTGQLDRLSDLEGQIEFINGDLADNAVSDRAVRNIDYVFHQAALPSVQRSVSDPLETNRANVTATLNLLESCRMVKIRRFVYAASSSAYGDTEVLPKHEEMSPNPLSPYALQKLMGEYYCKLYYDLYRLETVCLRYFNVFGPGQDPYSEYSAVIPKFTTKLLAGEAITVYGDGEQSRDFTYIDNVVEANLLAIKSADAAGKMCNVGCGERITLNRLIEILERIIGAKAQVTYALRKSGDVRHSLADIDSAKNFLGYEPRVMVEEGLRRTVAAMAEKRAEL
jgi:nucleoside-diphosphate-sugar epimerase